MPSYLPASDPDFDAWQANFMSYANSHLAALGLTPGDLLSANSLALAWTGRFTANLAARAAARRRRSRIRVRD
ncbi:MAG: hypothetical protein FLDDKLPJ_03456 [Phycisphaerae bacterium]|nr:hypothetical protein [Phycisphaerae bacterium]